MVRHLAALWAALLLLACGLAGPHWIHGAAAQEYGPLIFATGACLEGGPVPPTPKTITGYFPVNSQSGTSYAIVAGDRCKLVDLTNAATVGVTLSAPSASYLPAGSIVFVQPTGAGGATLTPSGATIDGGSSKTLSQGQGAIVFSDGTNYETWGSFTTLGALASLANGSAYQMLRMNSAGSAPEWENAPYDIVTDMQGVPAAGAEIGFLVTRAFQNPSGMANGQCSANTAPTGSATVSFLRNGSSIGSFAWAGSATTCTITFSSTVTWAIGDKWALDFPNPADATFADIHISVPGVRQANSSP